MPEPGFFPRPEPRSVEAVAALAGAVLRPGGPAGALIDGVASLGQAGPGDVTYFENRRHLDALAATAAAACFCPARLADLVPPNVAALITEEPYLAFAVVAAELYPAARRPQPLAGQAGISPAAHVDAAACLEEHVTIEPGAVVGPGAELGRGALIGPGAVVGPMVRVGRETVIGAGATVTHALIGDRVVIHPGARVGQDGFGYIPGSKGHTKIVQAGRVIIQNDVEIGANTTIDRGSHRDTTIGEGTKIDNLVQIAHNVVIGRHCLIAGQVGISGSVTIGDFVMLGGSAGIRDNLTIGSGARLAAAAKLHSNVPAGETWGGSPAMPVDKWRRQLRAISRLVSRRERADGAVPKTKDEPDGD